jgi:hypothetical protein
MHNRGHQCRFNRFCRGSTAVEFALVSIVFMAMLIAVIDFGRYAYVLNAASEATRLGARLAAVCNESAPIVRQRMRDILPLLNDANIVIAYPSATCEPIDCTPVTVSLDGVSFDSIIPLASVYFTVPAFRTALTRESLDSTNNAVCN